MQLFELVRELAKLKPETALSYLKKRTDISAFSKNDAPYYLQPEGALYQVVSYDYYFKNGDCITFTVKESQRSEIVLEAGIWDCFSAEKGAWFHFKYDDFILHDTYRVERKNKPKFSEYS